MDGKQKRLENLRPRTSLTKEEAKKMGAAGGKASAKVKKEKKLMSQIYAEFLVERFKIEDETTGKRIETTGEKLVNEVVKKIIATGGGPAVTLMKEIREATEGSKVEISGELPVIVIEGPDA